MATDASNKGIGGVLYQNYISFASRSLNTAEKGYGATKRELLAIVFCLNKFRNWIWGQHLTLYTDHKALFFMFTQKHINQMLNNWLETLLDFDFQIIHRPGVHHTLPDAISRFYDADAPPHDPNETIKIWASTPIELMDTECLPPVPEDQRALLLERAHAKGHFGAQAMFKALFYN